MAVSAILLSHRIHLPILTQLPISLSVSKQLAHSHSHALVRDSGGVKGKEASSFQHPGSKAPRWSLTTSTSTVDVDATRDTDSILLTPILSLVQFPPERLPGFSHFRNLSKRVSLVRFHYDMDIEADGGTVCRSMEIMELVALLTGLQFW